MRRRGTVRTKAVAVLAAALTLAATAVLAPPGGPAPAGAADLTTASTTSNAVTWADGTGRQHVALAFAHQEGSATEETLTVLRDLPTGQPDASWGTFLGHPGLRALAPEPPAAGLVLPRTIAAAPDGVLTLTWLPASCTSPTATCTVWFSRITAAGVAVGTPSSIATVMRPWRALPDGSILLADADGHLGWRAADGTDRGDPGPTATTLVSATVDGDGALLATTTDGTITRRLPGQAPDLTLATSCPTTKGFAIGAAPDGGFATACGSATPASVTTTRYDDAGAVAWTTSGTDAARPLVRATHVAVDSTDRIWVAGEADVDQGITVPFVVLQPMTSSGPGATAYERPKVQPGHYDVAGSGMAEVRAGAAGHVVYADLQRCCTTLAGLLPQDRVRAATLPHVPTAPVCAASDLSVQAPTTQLLPVRFLRCTTAGDPDAAVDYLVVPTGPGSAGNTIVPAGSGGYTTANLEAHAGFHVRVTITPRNAQGEGPQTTLDTVAPFGSTALFVARQYADLLGRSATDAERTTAVTAIDGETKTPGEAIAGVLASSRAGTIVEPVARIYGAAFLRDPDLSGLTYWSNKVTAGRTLRSVAADFAASSEFRGRYGALTDAGFVAQLYRNTLGREGDPAGLAYWSGRIQRGKETRGSVLLKFSVSSEYVGRVRTTTEPLAAVFTLLGRLPTPFETIEWQAPSGTSTWSTVADAVYRSDQYVARVVPAP